MQIVYDYQIFNWQQYGGISRYFCEVGSRMALLAETKVRFLAGLHINDYLARNHGELTIGQLRPAGKIWNRLCKPINREWSRLYLAQRPPDILHYTHYDIYPAAAKFKVLSVYDMIDERFPDPLFLQEVSAQERQKWQILHDRILHQKQVAIAAVDHIIVPTLNTKKDLLEFCEIDPQKITVVYHGCGLTPPVAAAGKVHAKPYILFVGKRDWYKNFARLLAAYGSRAALHREFDLICFGAQPFAPDELEAIAQQGLSPNQVIWKTGSDEELVAHYQQAAVFAYPSLYEGFGYPPMEAMTIGCPVACGNVSCFPETVADAAQLFDPYNVESIATALQTVLDSTERQSELIRLGQERAKRFSWQECAEGEYAVYQKLLS